MGLATIFQVSKRRLGFVRLERHGHEPRLDALANRARIRKILLGPESLRGIPETDCLEKRHAEIKIRTLRAEKRRDGFEGAVQLQGRRQCPVQHVIDCGRSRSLLICGHIWPAIPEDLGHIVVVMVCEVARMLPAKLRSAALYRWPSLKYHGPQ